MTGPYLRWNSDREHFIALGNTKGYLNVDFTWPPTDWVNPVTDEEEKAFAEASRGDFERLLLETKEKAAIESSSQELPQ